ncbi:hypothetical protein B0H67DRAFT_198277 [Lasiosphaeris hirsuta]|uniref:Uncharacterized protein n=1 Tax=Lasiosphaeris hirsuta TaxID=260670 RepID=A0AA40ARG3_9PEZI|nr:hypothetical protein B0H67DRAFT_198277 [Lasiosphaeris hirsuta]
MCKVTSVVTCHDPKSGTVNSGLTAVNQRLSHPWKRTIDKRREATPSQGTKQGCSPPSGIGFACCQPPSLKFPQSGLPRIPTKPVSRLTSSKSNDTTVALVAFWNRNTTLCLSLPAFVTSMNPPSTSWPNDSISDTILFPTLDID